MLGCTGVLNLSTLQFQAQRETDSIYRSNLGSTTNPLITSYAKLLGIQKLDVFTTGSGADKFNDNKFTLARVALYNGTGSYTGDIVGSVTSQITGSAADHIIDAAYIRDASPDPALYTVRDGSRAQ